MPTTVRRNKGAFESAVKQGFKCLFEYVCTMAKPKQQRVAKEASSDRPCCLHNQLITPCVDNR